MNIEKILEKLWDYVVGLAPRLLFVIVLVLVGHFLIKALGKLMHKTLAKLSLDRSLINFLDKAARIALYIVLALVALSSLGIPTAGILAAFSAAAAAVALALKDSLSNIASGIMLLFTHPFVTGDFIEVGGDSGTVEDIDLMHTVLKTPDNKHVVIPNGQMATSEIINYSVEKTRRVELKFSVGYDSDIKKAKDIITECVKDHKAVLREEEIHIPFVRVSEYSDSAIIITARFWTNSEDYWTAYYDLLEEVKSRFDTAGITVPYNQLDVHLVDGK